MIAAISGGMTNDNYRVTTPAGDYVVRIAADESGELGIDRDNEHHNSLRAAEAGVGAPIVARVRDPEALVVGFVAGVTLTPEHFSDPRRVTALAAALRRLHRAQPFARDFSMARVQQRYHEIVVANGYPLPADYARYASRAQRMAAVLAQTRVRTAPCHNDLMPGNFIESDGPGSPLWIVDYEYSGNNDPGYDLGDAINELELDAGQAEQLVTAYHGSAQPKELARARLWSLISQWGWSLWGSIRIGATGDPEIRGWADAMWARAVAQFESPDFEELLMQAPSAVIRGALGGGAVTLGRSAFGLGRDDQSFELGDVDLDGVALAFDHIAVIELGEGGDAHRRDPGGGPAPGQAPDSRRRRGRGFDLGAELELRTRLAPLHREASVEPRTDPGDQDHHGPDDHQRQRPHRADHVENRERQQDHTDHCQSRTGAAELGGEPVTNAGNPALPRLGSEVRAPARRDIRRRWRRRRVVLGMFAWRAHGLSRYTRRS